MMTVDELRPSPTETALAAAGLAIAKGSRGGGKMDELMRRVDAELEKLEFLQSDAQFSGQPLERSGLGEYLADYETRPIDPLVFRLLKPKDVIDTPLGPMQCVAKYARKCCLFIHAAPLGQMYSAEDIAVFSGDLVSVYVVGKVRPTIVRA